MTHLVFSRRLPFLAIMGACLALLGYGLYLQLHDRLEPCPLCIFQRLAYLGVAVVAAAAALHGPRRGARLAYALAIIAVAGAGAAIAGRQTWLQHLPADQVPECGPDLAFMLDTSPLAEVIKTVLRGTGECAVVDWTFLGLSIAEWSLACFAGIMAVAAVIAVTGFSRRALDVA